jgi:hypothetical protein
MKVKLNQKIVALGASGLVLFSGATVTSLAAWTDTEWVNGGVSTLPGVTSSLFDVEQNVTGNSTSWTTDLASPGATVNFGTQAAELTPNTSVVGFVRLRVIANSTGGTLSLNPGVSTGSAPFLADLTYGAWLVPSYTDCTAGGYDGAGTTNLVPDGSALTTAAVPTFTLLAGSGGAPGPEQAVCFRLEFPALTNPADKSLQGLSADPIWQFNATSN